MSYSMNTPKITGWVEIDGQRLTAIEIRDVIHHRPEKILTFGGEFFLAGQWLPRTGSFWDHAGQLPERNPDLQR